MGFFMVQYRAMCVNEKAQLRVERMGKTSYPVTSYGIICFRIFVDFKNGGYRPQYLLIQRKDSIAFVEFVRGRYKGRGVEYVKYLLGSMTEDEKIAISSKSFIELWNHVWGDKVGGNFANERMRSQLAYSELTSTIDLPGLVTSVEGSIPEREWGFPKGRRGNHESEIACAQREFAEETNVSGKYIHVYPDRSYSEVFDGGNDVTYRHVYYLARVVDMRTVVQNSCVPMVGSKQAQEVAKVQWFTYEDMLLKFGDQNNPRVLLASKANSEVWNMLVPYDAYDVV